MCIVVLKHCTAFFQNNLWKNDSSVNESFKHVKWLQEMVNTSKKQIWTRKDISIYSVLKAIWKVTVLMQRERVKPYYWWFWLKILW